jgi:hypothetical protein
MAIDTCFKCFVYFQMYVANVLSGCFKTRSFVVGRCPPTVAGAPSWFTCRCMRPTDTSAVRIRGRGKRLRVAVPPCGCRTRYGHRARYRRAARDGRGP